MIRKLSLFTTAIPFIVFNFHARYVHLSAGELLREERASGSSDGQLIDEYIREGRIVPVAISLGLLRKAMEASGPHARFLIDGFPRNSDNVEASKPERSSYSSSRQY